MRQEVEETITLLKATNGSVIVTRVATVGHRAFVAGKKGEMYYAPTRLAAIGRLCRSNSKDMHLRPALLERMNDEELGHIVDENPGIRGTMIFDGDAT